MKSITSNVFYCPGGMCGFMEGAVKAPGRNGFSAWPHFPSLCVALDFCTFC